MSSASTATALITALAKTKAVFCVTLLHTRHQLIGFTGLNGKTYFSALDVCRILNARDPQALAQHIGSCQMKNVTPFSGRLFLYPNSWVIDYHGLLYFLNTVLLDRARSTLPETPARHLKTFLERGVVVVPIPTTTTTNDNDEDDGGVILLKEADTATQIQAIAALSENNTSNNTSPTTTNHQCNQYSYYNDYDDVDDVEPVARAAEGGAAAPAPSSIQPFVLWMFDQRSKMLYYGA